MGIVPDGNPWIVGIRSKVRIDAREDDGGHQLGEEVRVV